MKRIFVMLLVVIMVLLAVACSNTGSERDNEGSTTKNEVTEEDSSSNVEETTVEDPSITDPLYKYPEKVTLSVGIYHPTGYWDMVNNPLTQLFEEELNVKIEAAWDLPWAEHHEKVKLSIATSSLPDACVIHDYNLVKQLAESGQLADLTETQKLFSPWLKESYASFEGNRCLNDVTFGGKLYAIPSTGVKGQHEILWIRKDWMDTLGLKEPKTIDDVMKIAEAFVKQDPDKNSKDDTIGIPFNRWIFGSDNAHASLDPFFAAFDAFPRAFFTDNGGKVVYGSIQPEMKAALGKAAEYYKSGLIYVSETDGSSKITSGKCGMIFGPWWAAAGSLRGSREANPDVEWVPFNAPLNSNGKLVATAIPSTTQTSGYLVVRNGYKYPEAAVRVVNAYYSLAKENSVELLEKYTGDKEKLPNFGEAPINIQIDSSDVILNTSNKMKKAVETGSIEGLTESEVKIVDQIKMWQEDPSLLEIDQWVTVMNLWVGAPAAFTDFLEYRNTCIDYLTPSMEEKFTSLRQHEDGVFYQIITGEAQLDMFDNFVTDWKNMGGDNLISEIQENISNK